MHFLIGIPLCVACAQATESGNDDTDSGGPTGGSHTGGRAPISAGGHASGGERSDNTGGKWSGGSSLTGHHSGGRATLTGGTESGENGTGASGTDTSGGGTDEYNGGCAGQPTIPSSVHSGDTAVFACDFVQAACTAPMVGELSLWECVSEHANNCQTQTPTGGTSWKFLGLCAELGMGGAGGAAP